MNVQVAHLQLAVVGEVFRFKASSVGKLRRSLCCRISNWLWCFFSNDREKLENKLQCIFFAIRWCEMKKGVDINQPT